MIIWILTKNTGVEPVLILSKSNITINPTCNTLIKLNEFFLKTTLSSVFLKEKTHKESFLKKTLSSVFLKKKTP